MSDIEVTVLPDATGELVVWGELPDMAPVKLAHCASVDTVCLLLYVLGNGPGVPQLLAEAPEVIQAIDAHCGHYAH